MLLVRVPQELNPDLILQNPLAASLPVATILTRHSHLHSTSQESNIIIAIENNYVQLVNHAHERIFESDGGFSRAADAAV
jgi:hypothetical protein